MIKPGEYIQILEFFGKPNNINFLIKYSAFQNIEIIEGCKRLDELRILHNKFKKECDAYVVYPHLDLTKKNMLQEDILRICNEFKITVIFPNTNTLEFKKGIQAFYSFEHLNITDLIIFNKERKPSQVSH